LIVGPETYQRTKDDFLYLKLDDLAVKGKTVGLEIYTVLDLDRSKHQAEIDRHNEMHKLYRQQEFQRAIGKCVNLQDAFEGEMAGYYKMWMERCQYMKTQMLPADWNGVFVATSK